MTLVYHASKWEADHSASGLECLYITHAMYAGDHWYGIKAYPRAHIRDDARKMQRVFADKGLAPPVGAHVRVIRSMGRGRKPMRMHGYLTGMATEPYGVKDDCWAMRSLEARIKRAGLSIGDLGVRNTGYWKGSLVCIDFGPCSEAERISDE